MQNAAYAEIAQLLLTLKAKGLTTDELAEALFRAAREAGISLP